jgi:hypothetical protein
MGIWNQLDYLMGQSLKTLERDQPFEILEITPSAIQIIVYSTKETRRIDRGKLEGAWMQLNKQGTISGTSLLDDFSSSNYAYIAAIMAAMPGVSYRADPLELQILGAESK